MENEQLMRDIEANLSEIATSTFVGLGDFGEEQVKEAVNSD